MKQILISVFCIVAFKASMAQQKPHYTQYILNNYILNPAISGIENYTDVKLSYRNQWAGIPGAPKTTYFSIHGALGKDDIATTATSYAIPGENPRGKAYWREYTAPPPHHGIGGSIISDIAGYISRTSVYGSYAYHRPLSPKISLSGGFQAGGSLINLDRTKINWGNLNPNDPAIGVASNDLRKFKVELGAGLWAYSSDWFLGVSVLNIIPSKAKFTNTANYGTYYQPHYFAQAGYRFFLTDDISLLPSVCLQKVGPTPVQIHMNAKGQYQDRVWAAVGYRTGDVLGGLSGMAGVNISNSINIGYSYDMATTSRLRTYSKNTSEFIVGFILGNKYADLCPRNVW